MWARFRSWIGGLVGRPRVERDLADEFAFHLQARTEHWLRQALPPDEAERRARIEFGAAERFKEHCRQARGLRLADELRGDLTYALRRMVAAPVFTTVAVAILAVAIGANTAIVSVLDAVLRRMLPVEQPQALRELAWIQPKDSAWQITYDGSMRPDGNGALRATSFAYPIYAHVRDRSTVFADLFLFEDSPMNLGLAGHEYRAAGLLVSGNFFHGLGAKMLLGRPIIPDDDRAGAAPVAVASYGLWQRVWGGVPDILGKVVTINGTPAVIVGVTPPAFYGVEPGRSVEAFAPITTIRPLLGDTRSVFNDPKYWGFRVMGRIKAGVDDGQAQVDTEALVRQALPAELANGAPASLPRVVVTPGGQGLDGLRRNYAPPLYLLLAIMAAVLLVACANIAGLLLTRTAARERELSVRLALGAGRGRLIRQLLTESVLLACLGGGLGIVLALVVRGGLLPLLNQDEAPIELALGIGPGLFVASAGLCLVVGLLCGVLPGLRAMRLGANLALTRAVPGGLSETSRLFAGKTLIALQVALSLVLVVGAGLFMRTLVNLRAEPLGFRPDHVLLFEMDATASGYTGSSVQDFYERALERVAAVPGVSAASLSRYGLLSGGATTDTIVVPGQEKEIRVHVHYVSPRHFDTMGIALLGGRDFTSQDREKAPRVALVNQALARLLSASGAAIGRRIRYDTPDSDVEIIGVAGDARFASLREAVPPTLYLPYRQYRQHRMTFAARVAGNPAEMAGPMRRAIEDVAAHVPVFEMRTQGAQIDAAVRQERLFAYVASGFALLALLLACLGIYGTLSYSVARRTSEIGLRMALGADRRDVVVMVLRESIVPVIVGVAVGLAGTVAATRFVGSMLFGLSPYDKMTLGLATLGLILSALVAAWLPSHRASRVDPMTALRCE